MTKGNRIKALREKIGKSQVAFADLIGVSKQTLYKYENDIITNIPSDKIEAIAKETHSTPGFIMGWEDSSGIPDLPNVFPIDTATLPVLGQIACGEPIFMNEEREFYVQKGTKVKADYIVIARGDSMKDARINDGDIVFIRKQPTVENGEIAAVSINDEATLKRFYFYKKEAMIILKAANPMYDDMIYQGDRMAEVRILGKAVAFQSDVL